MAAAAAVVLAACSSNRSAPARPVAATSPGALTVRGDWDDVDAALEAALSRSEMAILRRSEESPDKLYFELITIRSEPGSLTVTRDHGAGDQLIPIHLEARIGHFGEPASEQ